MQRYIAFLSGLPPGDAVTTDALRKLFAKLGFLNIETYLQSGNVAFETGPVGLVAPLEAQVSRHLKNSIAAEIWTFIRTPEELTEIAAHGAFLSEERDVGSGSLFIVFLSEPLTARAQRQLRLRGSTTDTFHVKHREIYWWRRTVDAGGTAPPPAIANILGGRATVRSAKTVRRLAEKYPSHSRSISRQPEKTRG